MANILRVTTPVVPHDTNNNALKPNAESQPQSRNIQGEIRPDQVVRPDARSDAAPKQSEADLKYRFETNFDNFIQQLNKSATLSQDFSTVFLERLGILAKSGLKADFAAKIAEFLNMISMSPKDLAAFLKMQGQSSIRFSGTFFEILRQIMQQSSSVELRAGILDFLKRYTDMSEGDHLLKHIQQLMQNIKESMLKTPREQLSQLEQMMNYNNAANGSVKQNADVLKNQLLPFINNYITQMHERGSLRENTAMLTVLTARYENGDAGKLVEAFMKLMEFSSFSERFKNLDPAALLKILENSEFEKASLRNNAMGHLADIIRRGVMGEAGIENKMAFRELMQAFLLNESVYMPVLHMTLPLNVDGTYMFSELWVDPDAEGGGLFGDGNERVIKGLIKFDISDVGFFDLFFLYGTKSGKTSMQLNYPKDLDATESEIRTALAKILADNGLTQQELVLGQEDGSIPISAAFPQIYERKNSINVTV